MTTLELNEIEALSLLANKAMNENKGTSYEALYRTIRNKLLKMFDEEKERLSGHLSPGNL